MPHSNQPKKKSLEWNRSTFGPIAQQLCFGSIETHVDYDYLSLHIGSCVACLSFRQRERDTLIQNVCVGFLHGGAYSHIAQPKDFYISFEDVRRAYNSHIRCTNSCVIFDAMSAVVLERIQRIHARKMIIHFFYGKSHELNFFFCMVKRSY